MDNCICGINYFGENTLITKFIVFYVNHFVVFFILQQLAILVFVTKYIEDGHRFEVELDDTSELDLEKY
jgi:hypothetical protein